MRAVIVAGSALEVMPDRAELAGSDLLIAVDAGADVLQRIGLRPDVLIGDMDSVGESARVEIRPGQASPVIRVGAGESATAGDFDNDGHTDL